MSSGLKAELCIIRTLGLIGYKEAKGSENMERVKGFLSQLKKKLWAGPAQPDTPTPPVVLHESAIAPSIVTEENQQPRAEEITVGSSAEQVKNRLKTICSNPASIDVFTKKAVSEGDTFENLKKGASASPAFHTSGNEVVLGRIAETKLSVGEEIAPE